MKLFLPIFIFVVFLDSYGLAQKLPLDTTALKNWSYLSGADISNDGRYASYRISNPNSGDKTLIVTSSVGKWEKTYRNFSESFFSEDSKHIVIRCPDTLKFVSLQTDSIQVVSGVRAYKYPLLSKGKWLAYQKKNRDNNELVVTNLVTNDERRFLFVKDFLFDDYGKMLVLVTTDSAFRETGKTGIHLLDLATGVVTRISSLDSGLVVRKFIFDRDARQLAFLAEKGGRENSKRSIGYYAMGMEKASMLVSDYDKELPVGLTVGDVVGFSNNGRWLFFKYKQVPENYRPEAGAVMVDIWSYKDETLKPEQARRLKSYGPDSYTAVLDVKTKKVVRVEEGSLAMLTRPEEINGDYTLVKDNNVAYWWQYAPQPSFYLLSLKDGSRKLFKKQNNSIYNPCFSITGRYLVYFDRASGRYYSYDIFTDSVNDLTKTIPVSLFTEYFAEVDSLPVGRVIGWIKRVDGERFLIYDNYDIWELDPAARQIPINVTNYYGRKHGLKLRLIGESDYSHPFKVFDKSDLLILTAFAPQNKYNGFFATHLTAGENPRLLTLGPYLYYRTRTQRSADENFSDGMMPLKARDTNIWVIMRQTAKESPNYFLTTDFHNYRALSDLQPQKNYNWLTTELVSWKQFDGTMSQGILYKPENFDPQTKYPLIFNYYEKMSYRLYEYPKAGFTEDNINIPWFVSHGYLVFTPDIYYKPANTSGKTVGEWAYNSVVSAAQYLSKLPFVNAKAMGIQGHSFGGLETSYLVTHSHIFAAAAEAAGSTDPISAYLTLVPADGGLVEHFEKQSLIERSHELYGASLWERPDLYLKNSSVLSAKSVTTPLLIMHNIRDNQVPWRQGIELYMALRRLGKKVWMLQYDDNFHTLHDKSAKDYTIRLMQFFDYYLKGKLPPKWMTVGVPVSRKGIETGYEFDTSGAIP